MTVGGGELARPLAGRRVERDLDAVEAVPPELALQQRAQRLVEVREHRVERDGDDEGHRVSTVTPVTGHVGETSPVPNDDVRAGFARAAAEDGIVLGPQSFDWLCEQGHLGLERVAKARRDPAIVEPVKSALVNSQCHLRPT